MAITTEQVKVLREATGAGILECKKALEFANGDYEKAVDHLREKGLGKAAKRADKEASEGYIELYSHGDGRVGVILELNCETDFVARSESFRELAHEIALQIAAMSPQFITEKDVAESVLDREREIARNRAKEEGTPDHILDRIVEGRINKYYDEVCLMRQSYIRNEDITIANLIHEKVISLGENVVVRRFARWELGEGIE